MDDLDFSLVAEAEVTTRFDLRARFYKRNRFRSHEWDGSSRLTANKPLAFVRNDEETRRSIRVQYGEGYYVIIEQGKQLMTGPHKGMLYVYNARHPEGIWLGTKQFDGAFFNEKLLRKQLRTAIKDREYWCSTESEDEEIEIEPESQLADLNEIIQLPLRKKNRKEVIFTLKRMRLTPNMFGGIRFKIPKCPICEAKRMTEAKMAKHVHKVHGKKAIFKKPTYLMPSWGD